MTDPGASSRLRGWKQIATFFGTNERTVKRWEAVRGLPVHRAGKGGGVSVYADARELESWLRDSGTDQAAAPPVVSRAGIVAMVAAVLIAAAGTAAFVLIPAPLVTTPLAHRPSPAVAELHLSGVYYLERRTPDSLRHAQKDFSEAIRRDPLYAPPYAGLANSWLLLREYTPLPEEVAYPHARQAAQRAIELDPRLAEGHLALAFVRFFGEHRFRSGLASFERAIALDPRSARGQHWFATALVHSGDARRALVHIDLAQELDPQSRAIRADKGWLLYLAGRRTESLALLRQLEASDPDFLSPRAYLAGIALTEGDDAGFIREARAAAQLRKDSNMLALVDSAEAGLHRGGRATMLRALLAAERRGPSSYRMATTEALLGNRAEAVRLLGVASAARDPLFVGLRADPALWPLRADPAFLRLSATLDS